MSALHSTDLYQNYMNARFISPVMQDVCLVQAHLCTLSLFRCLSHTRLTMYYILRLLYSIGTFTLQLSKGFSTAIRLV